MKSTIEVSETQYSLQGMPPATCHTDKLSRLWSEDLQIRSDSRAESSFFYRCHWPTRKCSTLGNFLWLPHIPPLPLRTMAPISLAGQLWPWLMWQVASSRGSGSGSKSSHPRDRLHCETFTNESERVSHCRRHDGEARRDLLQLAAGGKFYLPWLLLSQSLPLLLPLLLLALLVSFWVNNFGDRLNSHQAASDARPVNIAFGTFSRITVYGDWLTVNDLRLSIANKWECDLSSSRVLCLSILTSRPARNRTRSLSLSVLVYPSTRCNEHAGLDEDS